MPIEKVEQHQQPQLFQLLPEAMELKLPEDQPQLNNLQQV